jgi:hypothetical protein
MEAYLIGAAIVVGYLLAGALVYRGISKATEDMKGLHPLTCLIAWPLVIKIIILSIIVGGIDFVADHIWKR